MERQKVLSNVALQRFPTYLRKTDPNEPEVMPPQRLLSGNNGVWEKNTSAHWNTTSANLAWIVSPAEIFLQLGFLAPWIRASECGECVEFSGSVLWQFIPPLLPDCLIFETITSDYFANPTISRSGQLKEKKTLTGHEHLRPQFIWALQSPRTYL